MYAGTDNFGIYRSFDNGATWTQTTLNNLTVYSIASSNSIIYAGTNNFGIYRSTDNGVTWTQLSLNNIVVRSLAISGNDIYAGTNDGVYKNNIRIFGTFPSVSGLTGNANIFASTGFVLYRSADAGISWLTTSMNQYYIGSIAAFDSNIFVGTQNNGLYRSTDNGENWIQTSVNRVVLSIASSGSNIYAGTYEYGVYRSADNGVTWSQTSLNNHRTWSIAAYGSNVFAGTAGGVYRSQDNGITWSISLYTGYVNSLIIIDSNIFAGIETVNPGIHRSTNNGATMAKCTE